LLGGVVEPGARALDLSRWSVYLLGLAVEAAIAVAVAQVLRAPAKAGEAIAAKGTPLDRTS
jgi:hypothetical protein